MENTESKYPVSPPLKVGMPEVIYLREDWGYKILMGGVEYEYNMYCTTTFKTKLYKYRKV